MGKPVKVLNRATNKYMIIPDVCCIDAPGITDKTIILFRRNDGSYILQYITRNNYKRIQYMSKRTAHENFRCSYFKVIIP
jgi:hypothetical protein